MERETAGDPIRGLKWTGKTTAKIASGTFADLKPWNSSRGLPEA
jgi:hypothetical protein